ncbi:MAG: hypothetical protein L0G99_02405 [Propionibacteriales bacterium]|nr:hypothetical protein [Propionibacteriales bacterium]
MLPRDAITADQFEFDEGLLDNAIFDLFDGRSLRVFHATRLMEHEVEAIRQDGLRRLSPHLVKTRIGNAENAGALSHSEAQWLRQHDIYTQRPSGRRDGQVCALLGRHKLTQRSAVEMLLGIWGGEAIYWCAGDDMRRRLR